MTGEITIRGRVLPIGGLKEKTMAAYKAGMKTVILPKENLPDLEEVEAVVKENLTFVGVSTLDEVLPVAFSDETYRKPQPKKQGVSPASLQGKTQKTTIPNYCKGRSL